jgi:hypothetical protein
MTAATHVEFTSYVDRKYKIVAAKRHRKPGQDEAEWVLSSPMGDPEDCIVGQGGGYRAVQLSQYPHLFSEFAKVRTPEELLAFVTKYGRLTTGRRGDEIPPLLDQAKMMQGCLAKPRKEIRPTIPMTNLKAWLATNKANGTVSVKVGPTRLLDALWLQLGHSLAGGAQWRECEGCGVWFPVGGNSGKRLVAKFHSEECRIAFNSLERTRRKRRK